MKQHIDGKQYDELTKEQKQKIQDYFNKGIGDDWQWSTHYSQITIGVMIEFLLEQDSGYFSIDTLPVHSPLDFDMGLILVTDDKKTFRKPELCDALWEAVKEVLI